MKIITFAKFFVLFTIVQCIPFPPDPDDSEPEIIADNLPSDSGSDNEVVILPDPAGSDNEVVILPNPGVVECLEEPPIRIPSSPENSGPEDNDMDEQPPFLPNGVTGDESIQQTPELIRVWVRAPASLRNFDPDHPRHGVWHWRDRHLQPSTSTGARRGLTLRREWARLALAQQPVACLARRNIEEPRRNIGN